LPQGFLKKIEFNLLLADFAFQLLHPVLRSSALIGFKQRF
jgi:hypothetical protein